MYVSKGQGQHLLTWFVNKFSLSLIASKLIFIAEFVIWFTPSRMSSKQSGQWSNEVTRINKQKRLPASFLVKSKI